MSVNLFGQFRLRAPASLTRRWHFRLGSWLRPAAGELYQREQGGQGTTETQAERVTQKTPIRFSALELVRDERVHLASGRRTSFAKHLGYRLNTDNLESWPLVRDEFGELCEESWAVTTNSLQDNLARVGKLIVA
ncbi:putative C-type lectin protein [Seiridium cardinale]